MNNRRTAAILTLVGLLSACAGPDSALIESLRFALQSNSATPRVTLNPGFRYLRASIDGRVALLVLGYVEQHPEGPIEIWYSADREVLRLQNGRIVGAVGLTTEWRRVKLSAPPKWSSLKIGGSPARFTRTRDVMPGYRFGVRDNLILSAVPPPRRSALAELAPETLLWFEESVERDPNESSDVYEDVAQIARYAVSILGNTETVIYGEQCLSSKVCFAWQQWPAVAQKAKEVR